MHTKISKNTNKSIVEQKIETGWKENNGLCQEKKCVIIKIIK